MARLEIITSREGNRNIKVVLSRRNLLSLLHKLDMPGSARRIENNDCWENGEQCAYPGTLLVLCCEDDVEHYARRPGAPGQMHPDTEQFVQENQRENF